MTKTGEPRVPEGSIQIRTELQPGDIDAIVHLHGTLYDREYGLDHSFESFVAGPLKEFARSPSNRERIWLAERDDRIVGCIAIVSASPKVAQLRWYLVVPEARGAGLGRHLLEEAVAFCRDCGYQSVFLHTISVLTAAAHLYRSVGFEKVEEHAAHQWSVDVVEAKSELILD
jgi:N-acetylglutamate synthase-like GNAT family acetyltransferase